MSILTDCVCAGTKDALRRGFPHTVILTSKADADAARMSIAGVAPSGSYCNNKGVWVIPDGSTVEVFRYTDDVPDYEVGSVAFRVCHGKEPLSPEEVVHVQRWRKALPSMAS